jgi:predicted RNase H-like HicB family nuclease
MRVGLVTYEGSLHAWVLDLPGCVTGGGTIDDLAESLPLVIAEHVAWLRQHGEVIEAKGGWSVAEQVDGTALAATGGEFCFQAERVPLSRDELETMIARMDFARADLLDAVAAMPMKLIDWEPPASTVQSFDDWAQGVRSIREIVRHVLQLEIYYREGLRDGRSAGIFEAPREAGLERARTSELLRSLDDDARSRVYLPVRPSRDAPEPWTVRKLVRRIISHERAHTAEIVQRRTWLLAGMPSFREG